MSNFLYNFGNQLSLFRLIFICLFLLNQGNAYASGVLFSILQQRDSVEVMTLVDSPPEFEGGMSAFYKYIGKNFKLPATCRESAISGKVFVEFIVSEEGEVLSPKIIKGLELAYPLKDGTLHPAVKAYHEEMLRVFSHSPRWRPGTHEGVVRNVRMQLAVVVCLG
ncbi:energy transducer TonB [Persicobacter sp. CCB-QB2]|uniref:energy transducer TonB n=1 Tax=Persicobacter sp. CCB-QB2 TaxID=1561025 RepID=UPI0006A97DD2|nr:hypothetical protein [Persicobacter sp. CCB-QB2]